MTLVTFILTIQNEALSLEASQGALPHWDAGQSFCDTFLLLMLLGGLNAVWEGAVLYKLVSGVLNLAKVEGRSGLLHHLGQVGLEKGTATAVSLQDGLSQGLCVFQWREV